MKTNVLTPLCLLLCLTSCASERVVLQPKVVTETVTEYIPVPADYLIQHQKEIVPDLLTYGEAIALWAEDRANLDKANSQLESIGNLSNAERNE